jgi:hypothetical protein
MYVYSHVLYCPFVGLHKFSCLRSRPYITLHGVPASITCWCAYMPMRRSSITMRSAVRSLAYMTDSKASTRHTKTKSLKHNVKEMTTEES